jgi:hypothetical protein
MADKIIGLRSDTCDVACDYVKGEIEDFKPQIELWTTPGFEGVGAQRLATVGGPFLFLLSLYDTDVKVEAWIASLEALAGQVVTIKTDLGMIYYHCLITVVSPPRREAARPGIGGSESYESRCEIQISGVTTARQGA